MKRTVLSLIILSALSATAAHATVDLSSGYVSSVNKDGSYDVTMPDVWGKPQVWHNVDVSELSYAQYQQAKALQKDAADIAAQNAAAQAAKAAAEAKAKADAIAKSQASAQALANAHMTQAQTTDTSSVDPKNSWTMTPGIIKESNPEGKPTREQAGPFRSATATPDVSAARSAAQKAAIGNAKGGSFDAGKGNDLNTSNVGRPVETEHEVAVDHSVDAAKAAGDDRIKNNQQRTASQTVALTGSSLTKANQQRTSSQAVAKADAIQNSYDHPIINSDKVGRDLKVDNYDRTQVQRDALDKAKAEDQDRKTAELNKQAQAYNKNASSYRANVNANVAFEADQQHVREVNSWGYGVKHNSAGQPTNQVGTPSHLDGEHNQMTADAIASRAAAADAANRARQQAAVNAANQQKHDQAVQAQATHLDAPDHSREAQKAQHAAENQHGEALAQANRDRTASQKPTASHLDGVHSDNRQPSHATATATPNVDRSSHLDGAHSEPAHVTATATPNVDRSSHLDASDHAAEAAAAQAKAQGDALAADNAARTASQHVSQTTLTHQTTTAQPVTTTAAAQGAQLTQANIERTAIQHVDANAVAQATEQAAHAARYSMNTQPAVTITQPAKVSVTMSTLTPANKPTTVTKPAETIGVKTPMDTVPSTVTNVTTPVVDVPFVDKKGGNGKASTSHAEHGTGAGADNAHDHAFGGHTGAGGGYHY